MTIWRHSPFVAIVSGLALAMGIGFTTTMFSIVRGATRSLPFAEPHGVVAIQKIAAAGGVTTMASPFDYELWTGQAQLRGLGRVRKPVVAGGRRHSRSGARDRRGDHVERVSASWPAAGARPRDTS